MFEVKITIEAPELTASINNLANAMSGNLFRPVGNVAPFETLPSCPPNPDMAKVVEPPKGKKEKKPEAPKETPKPEEVAAPVETPAPEEQALAPKEQLPVDEAPTYTLEEVRAKLAEISKAGKQAQVKELIGKLGADKLSSVKPEDYGKLMKEAGAL